MAQVVEQLSINEKVGGSFLGGVYVTLSNNIFHKRTNRMVYMIYHTTPNIPYNNHCSMSSSTKQC